MGQNLKIQGLLLMAETYIYIVDFPELLLFFLGSEICPSTIGIFRTLLSPHILTCPMRMILVICDLFKDCIIYWQLSFSFEKYLLRAKVWTLAPPFINPVTQASLFTSLRLTFPLCRMGKTSSTYFIGL